MPKKKNGALAGIVSVPVCLRMTPSWLCFRVREDFCLFMKNTARPFLLLSGKVVWIRFRSRERRVETEREHSGLRLQKRESIGDGGKPSKKFPA